MPVIAVVLAAGMGKRMNCGELPKVLIALKGRPLLGYVLQELYKIDLDRIIVVVGYQRHLVCEYLRNNHPNIDCAVQKHQKGTADAVLQVKPLLDGWKGTLLIVNGDVPLITSTTLVQFLRHHHESGAALSVISTTVPNPSGYGRIVRAVDGTLISIIEDADLPPNLRTINEVNAGIYSANAELLFDVLGQVRSENAQQEYYLTDAVKLFHNRGWKVTAWCTPQWYQCLGANTPDELKYLERLLTENVLSVVGQCR